MGLSDTKMPIQNIDWKQFEGDRRIKIHGLHDVGGLMKYIGPESRDKFSLERFSVGAGGIIVLV